MPSPISAHKALWQPLPLWRCPCGTRALLQSSVTGEHRTHGEETHFETGLWFSFSSSFPHLFFFFFSAAFIPALKHNYLFYLPPEAQWYGWSTLFWDSKLAGDLKSQKVLAAATILSQVSKTWFSYSSSNQTNVININFHFLLLFIPQDSRKKMWWVNGKNERKFKKRELQVLSLLV